MGPICACGCGEYLPEGSTREYKRGHKSASAVAVEDAPDWTLDDVAASTDNDPEPADPVKGDVEKPIRITRAIKKDVEGKLAWMMAMSATVWSIQDPVCGTAFLDHTPNIAAKLTPILCQSPDVVKWFRKSSNAALYVDLLIAVTPVLQTVYAHHIAKSLEPPAGFWDDPQAPQNYAA